jgi:hypothetical protein
MATGETFYLDTFGCQQQGYGQVDLQTVRQNVLAGKG